MNRVSWLLACFCSIRKWGDFLQREVTKAIIAIIQKDFIRGFEKELASRGTLLQNAPEVSSAAQLALCLDWY